MLSTFLLAFSVSIDSLGMGISYGMRKVKIFSLGKIILFCISLSMTFLALLLGDSFSYFLSPFASTLIGSLLLITMGLFILWQSIFKKEEKASKKVPPSPIKTYQVLIRSLGLTIQIIRNPISSDIDASHSIDTKEAVYLGFALSIDSVCLGIGCSLLGLSSIFFPFLVAIFQLLFLSFGQYLGSKIAKFSHLPETFWNILSGILLLLMGMSRLFLH